MNELRDHNPPIECPSCRTQWTARNNAEYRASEYRAESDLLRMKLVDARKERNDLRARLDAVLADLQVERTERESYDKLLRQIGGIMGAEHYEQIGSLVQAMMAKKE